MLSPQEVRSKSEAIASHLFELHQPMPGAHVHVFLSIVKFQEVDTEPIISHLRSHFCDITIGVPKVHPEEKTLAHHVLQEEDLTESSWGILEPLDSAPQLHPQQFDLVLVPMLAFDPGGHRVGYGAGYYDRFLSEISPNCLKLGLCFELGRLEHPIPSEAFDVSLDCIVTESGVHVLTDKV